MKNIQHYLKRINRLRFQTNNFNVNKYLLLIIGLTFYLPALAYGDEDDIIDPVISFYTILAGLGVVLVGSLIAQAKITEGIGKIIKGIGFFVGGIGLLGIAVLIYEWAVRTVFTLALFVGALGVVGYILYQIYLALYDKKKD